ncbi:LPXTG-motif cell wall-anchored protein [Antricoccus suffuscus]|uniref:LPXTG-motif cell wall-anchored protein n=1 Tax=Antricoccus suffuscus TaxID=1629062 RepID=A0A2T1A6V5_9ACTN|nr:carboxypeptidase-like regulatory domain-containing protein [Antricoccus suffuscus]PRZ44058.1 LPXTG-motif cell wall-anchored protein [Antricoccus suffuscus]
MIRRTVSTLSALLLGVGALLIGIAPAHAEVTSGWATWTPITGTSNNYATTMQLPAQGFPKATVASDSRANVQLPSGASTYLGGASSPVPTPVGLKYGSSRNNPYLNLRPKADTATAPSTTTYTFDSPTPNTGWTFVLGDIDSDQVKISATGADGVDLTAAQIDEWKAGHDTFNYAGESDLPTWDPATSTLTGNVAAADTSGASAWFEPNISISSLTFTFTRRAGFPIYQTWFASLARTISGTVTDTSPAGSSCSIDAATVFLQGPNGEDLAQTNPVGGAYSFGQYATQDGYTVRIEAPPGCALSGPESQTVSTASADATADFSLRAIIPQTASGTITTTDGHPVAGVEVTLTPPGGGTAKVTTTDPAGNYLFDDNAEVAGYTVALTGVPDGFAPSGPASLAFDISPGSPVTGLDFILAELPAVSGTVIGGGDPLGGVTVTLTPAGGGTAVTTVTRGDGSYVFEHVPSGDYDIAVSPPEGFNPAAPLQGVAVGAADVTGQDFALTRPGALGGQVTDASSGSALSGATVTVTGPGGNRTLITDPDGNYFLDGLAPGTYNIVFTVPDGYTADGVTQRSVAITELGEIRGGQDFAVTPQPLATFDAGGTITADGVPLGNVTVTITNSAGTVVGTTTSAPEGTYTVPGLTVADDYVATVTAPDGYTVAGPPTVTFNVVDGSVSGIDFKLTKTPVGGESPAPPPTSAAPLPISGGTPPAHTLAQTGIAAPQQSLLALGLIVGGIAFVALGRRRRTA